MSPPPAASGAAGTMVSIPLIPAVELPPGQMRGFHVASRRISLYNVGGVFYATSDNCFHRGALLSEGDLEGAIVTCPWHGWQFDCRTGSNVRSPAACLETYPVTVVAGMVYVRVPQD